jgi:dTDP-4-dehydrorhamnose 3,5-epimerase
MSGYSIQLTKLKDVLRLDPPFVFRDERGENIETFNQTDLHEAGIPVVFIRDSLSISRKNVLRGLHGDSKTWKLISCLSGTLFLAVVDMREESEQYLKWEGFILSDQNREQILVPPGFANGHIVLSESAHFFYKMSHQHNRADQFTIAWDDPHIGIDWPVESPILSERDAGRDSTSERISPLIAKMPIEKFVEAEN